MRRVLPAIKRRLAFRRRRISAYQASKPKERLQLRGHESILVIAPHCDDETLGAGLLIWEAVQAGCRVMVVIVTNGDGFTYAAGRKYKRLRLPAQRHIEFAYIRQHESERACRRLGLSPEQVVFLGYPDRGLQAMWTEYWEPSHLYRSRFTRTDHSPYKNSYTPAAPYCGRSISADLRQLIAAAQPTHVVLPHPRDAHGDHAATFCFAMHALVQLQESKEIKAPVVLSYLVHRGKWPQPRGLHPRLEMAPPPSLSNLAEQWVGFTAGNGGVAAKQRAVMEYHSQLSLQARFLLSFVRHSEIYSIHAPMQLSKINPGVLIDGSAQEWPADVGYMMEPVRDTVVRNMERSADIRVMAVCADAGHLYVRLEMYGRISDEVTYILYLANCRADRQALYIRLTPANRVFVRRNRMWVAAPEMICRCKDRVLEAAVPRRLLGGAQQVLISAETRMRGLLVDKTAWQLLVLSAKDYRESAPVLASADRSDIPGIAAVFQAAFADEYAQIFHVPPAPGLLASVFELLFDAEPGALLVAKSEGRVVGYVFAPVSLRNLWRTALLRGYVLRWAWHWLRGRYNFGLSALRVLLLDKYYFVRNSLRDHNVEHRVLSLAVLPEARGMGIATHLVAQALSRFSRMGIPLVRLEVRPDNTEALSVYQRLGFTVRSKTYDSRGEWLVMIKELAPAGLVHDCNEPCAVPPESRKSHSDPQ